MIFLTSLELRKRWESLKWPGLYLVLVMLGLGLLAWALAPAEYAELPNRQSATASLLGMMTVTSMLAGYYPYVDAVWRFATDFRGRHAPLELGGAKATWQKVAAKLIASLLLYAAVWFLTGALTRLVLGLLLGWGAVQGMEWPSLLAPAVTILVAYLAVSVHLALQHRSRLAGLAAAVIGAVPVFLFDLAAPLTHLNLGGPVWYLPQTTLWIASGVGAAVALLGSVVLLDHLADI